MKWFENIPDAASVLAHETQHPRPDGIRLGRITVDAPNRPGVYVETDDLSYGEWVCYHHKSRLQPYVSVIRLKVANGVVLMAIGFTSWSPLSHMFWANESRYFPVGQDGLPKDFQP